MAEETKIDEIRGKYMLARKRGQELPGAEWRPCGIVLTNRRLVLEGDERVVLSLADIDRVGDRYDVNQAASAESDYSALYVDDDVHLVATPDHERFEAGFVQASLDGAVVYVRHPVVEGGVVQATEWRRATARVTVEAVELRTEADDTVSIDRDDITDVETGTTAVAGEEHATVEVEHTDESGTSLETHLAGRGNHLSVLHRVLVEGAERNRANLDLDSVERRVVVALYSGVSPFGISEFVDIDVERVEAIYDRLIELDVIEVERERTEVALTAQGRRVAGEAMGER